MKVRNGFATRSMIDVKLDSKEHATLKNQFSFENLNQDTFREIASNMGNKKFKIKIGKKIAVNEADVMEEAGSQL
jgi:hypothetical protein